MTRSKPITFLASAALIPLAALAVAACGGGGSAATAATPKTTSGASATVGVANSSLGSILVDSTGHTLYLFKADSSTSSACTGACASAWPPLLANGTPTAGTGLTASKLGTITRSGGNRQVTDNGHPLYLFIKDTKPGQTTGQGVTAFGAAWFALTPAGNQISATPPSSGGSGSSGAGDLLVTSPGPGRGPPLLPAAGPAPDERHRHGDQHPPISVEEPHESAMSRVRRSPYPFLVVLLAALAAGCGTAASAGDRISSVPVASADEASSLRQRFVSIVKAVSPKVVQIRTPIALGSGVVGRSTVAATRVIESRNAYWPTTGALGTRWPRSSGQ